MSKTLDQWFSHIKQIHQKRMDLGLDRIGVVADRLQLRRFPCPVITVGGTNGKGSCTKIVESIYTTAGFKTALYTSPHILEFNERIRIANKNIDDATLISAFSVIEQARQKIVLSVFEFTTLAALWLFQQAKCDVIILEVGLGGRLDAVNIVDSDVAVVTSIALDHMDWLGDHRESIATEKASIARAGKPFICGDENPPDNIMTVAQQKNAVLIQINQDFFYRVFDSQMACYGKDFHYSSLPLPHLKPQNVAIAICVIEILKKKLWVAEMHVMTGIREAKLEGRFEITDTPMPCVLDVAHNPHSASYLAERYAQLPSVKNTIAVVGMLKDKAMIETISPLLPFVDTWYVGSLLFDSSDRGSDGAPIVHFLQTMGIKNCYTFATISEAMDAVMQARCQQQCDRALIFGSFYTVAAAKRWLSTTGV